jgi:hypothetical protein
MSGDLPDIKVELPDLPYKREDKHQLITLQKNEFEICQPITREVSSWFGIKKKLVMAHRTAEGSWNIVTIVP